MSLKIYRFGPTIAEGDASMKDVLGGKGANLAEMAKIGIPVPPGFTIPCEACNIYNELGDEERTEFVDHVLDKALEGMAWLKEQFGYTPLVSVRSGAPVSMPGMMDTILNVGLDNDNLGDWAKRIGVRAAWDSYRRLVQMLGNAAFGISHDVFEFQLASIKKAHGVKLDSELNDDGIAQVAGRFAKVFRENAGHEFPDDPVLQLREAIKAVFDSWGNPRAIEYRKMNGIPESMGTAVNIQAMVFGNMGEDSGTGVLFTRNPSTGEDVPMGEFLPNAQGEDVVAGIRTPFPITEMGSLGGVWVAIEEELEAIQQRLEQHYRDMMDLEFTVQQGKLFLLQCRTGKRSALAAFRIAVDLVEEGLITVDEALDRLTAEQFKLATRPRVAEGFDVEPAAVGLPASVGVAVGKPVFSAEAAVKCTEPCILVSHDTCPDDIAGMAKAQGILTANGGATSHAAVVARAMDKPCVTGCTSLTIHDSYGALNYGEVGEIKFEHDDKITICGETGRIWVNMDVPVIDGSNDPAVKTVMRWCLERSGKALMTDRVVTEPVGAVQRIMAADFWGNTDVFDKVLQDLKKLGAHGAILDLTPPTSFYEAEDMRLLSCFGGIGTTEIERFWTWAVKRIISENERLHGLTVVCGDGDLANELRAAGVKVARKAETVADLIDGGYVEMDESFVQEVLGGQEVAERLARLMKLDGKEIVPLPEPVPAEYAVFTRLAG